MPATDQLKVVVLTEFDAQDLGTPFKVLLFDSVKQYVNCKSGKVERTIIPNLRGLVQKIALTRIIYPQKLSGQELRFIRKAVGIQASKLAEKIGVTPEHLSRCEAGERVLSSGAEKCLRVAVLLNHFTLPPTDDCEVEECLQNKIESFQKTLLNVQAIINEMNIIAVSDVNDQLVLGFKIDPSTSTDLFDDPDADWLDQPSALAA